MNSLCVIAGVGAQTSLGATAPETAFVYRTGHIGMRESAILDSIENKVTLCSVPTLDPWLSGDARLIQLALPALEEVMLNLGEHARTLRIKLYLCVDEWLGAPDASGLSAAQRVASSLLFRARKLAHENVTIETRIEGPAAPGLFLEQAASLITMGQADVIIVGAVHSDYDPVVIRTLEERGRLFSSDHLDGMIGGEGAAFLLLCSERLARKLDLTAHVALHSVGVAYERATPDNDESAYEAAGLTVAARKAMEPLLANQLKCGWLLGDATYEMREIYEWQALTVRSQRAFELPQQGDFPAHRLGHMGATALPLMLVLVFEAYRRGYAPHQRVMLYAGSDAGARTVLIAGQTSDSTRALGEDAPQSMRPASGANPAYPQSSGPAGRVR
ncbi:MAG: hypothetical protein KC766_23050 [Myxococcales bacterium]|nr:hypothetical protein [Myxococcales bacterium]